MTDMKQRLAEAMSILLQIVKSDKIGLDLSSYDNLLAEHEAEKKSDTAVEDNPIEVSKDRAKALDDFECFLRFIDGIEKISSFHKNDFLCKEAIKTIRAALQQPVVSVSMHVPDDPTAWQTPPAPEVVTSVDFKNIQGRPVCAYKSDDYIFARGYKKGWDDCVDYLEKEHNNGVIVKGDT